MEIQLQQIIDTELRLEQVENDREWANILDAFGEEQPTIFAYLMSIGEDDLNEDEREVLLFIGIVIWTCLNQNSKLGRVGEENFDRIQQENLPLWEELFEGPDHAMEKIISQLEEAQPVQTFYQYILESILEYEQENIRPQNQTVILLYLKVLVDSLLSARR